MRRAHVLTPLLDPVSGVPRAVEARRWVLPMLALCAAVTFSGVAFAVRLDASAGVLQKMEESGDLAKSSERELREEVEQAQRVALVAGAAKGVFVMPFALLLVAVALKITAWLCGRKLLFAHAFTVAAVAFLPVALYHLIFGFVALKQPVLVPSMSAQLLPSSAAVFVPQVMGKAADALRKVDFFNLWSVALIGLGFASGTRMPRGRALVLCLFLYVMLAALQITLPGMVPQGGGKPS